MGGGNISPRRNLQKSKDSIAKKKTKESFTHMEFLDYIDPFFESLKEKHLDSLKVVVQPKNFNLKKDVYSKWIEQLKEKLCSCYVFNDDVEFEKKSFETPLMLIQNIKNFQSEKTSFAEENEILENYRLNGFVCLLNEYKEQVAKNNARRKAIVEIILKRAKYVGYFHAFDLIKKELEDIQKKRSQSKKKRRGEFEDETVREYLNRINEFYDAFGTPDQQSDMDYSDIFVDNASTLELIEELQFFE